MMNSAISVVIPLYNKRNEIQRCLDSVAAQTVQPDEVIIVDDGSTDGSREVAAAGLRPGMRLCSQPNQGAAAARNTGIRSAGGSLIAFLDADDEWHPEFLSEIVQLKNSFPQAGAFGTAAITDKGPFRRFLIGSRMKDQFTLIAPGDGFKEWSPAGMWSSSVAIRREVFDTVGFFRAGIRACEDTDMWFRIACVYPVAYSSAPRAIWHWTAANRSTSLFPNEENFLGTSLQELFDRGLLASTIRPKAEAWMRHFNLRKALAIARIDPAKGLHALEAWRIDGHATLEWYLHYMTLSLHPKAYRPLVQYVSRAKDVFRWASTKTKSAYALTDDWRSAAWSARK